MTWKVERESFMIGSLVFKENFNWIQCLWKLHHFWLACKFGKRSQICIKAKTIQLESQGHSQHSLYCMKMNSFLFFF